MKVAEEGRTASEAMNIVKARFPDAKVMFAEGFYMQNNIINLKTHPLYIKKKIKNKPLNLFGAPIPEETIILHFEYFEKYLDC